MANPADFRSTPTNIVLIVLLSLKLVALALLNGILAWVTTIAPAAFIAWLVGANNVRGTAVTIATVAGCILTLVSFLIMLSRLFHAYQDITQQEHLRRIDEED